MEAIEEALSVRLRDVMGAGWTGAAADNVCYPDIGGASRFTRKAEDGSRGSRRVVTAVSITPEARRRSLGQICYIWRGGFTTDMSVLDGASLVEFIQLLA